MKKQYIIILIAMVVIAIILTIFRDKSDIPYKADENTGTTISEGLLVDGSYEVKTMVISDPYMTFDVKYPSFKNADESFNKSIEDLLNKQIEEDKITSKDNWKARYDTQVAGDNIKEFPTADEKFSFNSDFKIIQSNSSYISFVLNYGGFTGGAHGYEVNATFNYDVKNQKILKLKDMFPNNKDYLKYLSDESRKYLIAQYATASEEDKKNSSADALKEYIDNMVSVINQGTEPKEDNFSSFTFTPDKIRIYFADYQVGPHAIGMPEIEVDRK